VSLELETARVEKKRSYFAHHSRYFTVAF